MKRHNARSRRKTEDATSQGGWLFADSFLALMVIFLATISFVPMVSSSTSPDEAVGSAGNYKNAYVIVYDQYSKAKFLGDLNAFIAKESLPPKTRILYAEILGGYDQTLEKEYDGNLKGLAFAIKLKQDAIPAFNGATINVGATPSIKPDQVLVRLTLAKP